MLKKVVCCCGFLVLIVSGVASASLSKSSGAYVEGNLGVDSGSKVMGSLNLGYKANGSMAVEVGYTYLNHSFGDIALKGIMAFTNGWELFGKVGPAVHSFDWKSIEFYGALGTDYAFTPNLSSSLQGVVISGGGVGATLGFTYIF